MLVTELLSISVPHLGLNLRKKLNSTGFYDDFEVTRVIEVEFDQEAKQPYLRT